MCAMEDTSDTLTLAAEERAKQGIHELEISFGGELDLHKHFHLCQKNPGHPDFIPVNKFQEHHLPKHRHSHKIAAWIKQMSDLSVKLSVNYVSPNRPSGYPLSDRAGQRVLSVGSGFVADVSLKTYSYKLPCPLKNCGHRRGYHDVCYITIVTAAHVVFDDEEAQNTTVEFFYDDSSDRSGVMKASGVRVAASSVEGDFCELLCVTHETELFEILKLKLMCAKNEVSDTQPIAVEERARQLIQELKISFRGKRDLHKYFIKCWENAEDPDVIRVNEIEKLHLSKHRYSHEKADYVRQMSDFTVKLSVNYVSPNRPSGYPLSDRAGQRVLSVGSGFVADISLTGNNAKLPCPLKNCGHRPGYHEVFGYITIVTAAHVVFDDEEAKNTTVEFFYDSSDRSRGMLASGVRVGASSKKGHFCALLCVTHETDLFEKLKNKFIWRENGPKAKEICQLFSTLLPGLESIQYMPGAGLKFLAEIRLNNPGEAVKALIVLKAFTEVEIDSVLRYWNPSSDSLSDVLEHTHFSKEDILALIKFEECIVRRIGDYVSELRELYSRSYRNNNINTHLNCQDAILSLILVISELDKHSSLYSLEKALSYLWNSSQCDFLNSLHVQGIRNGIATISVLLSTKDNKYASDYSKSKPDDSKSKPNDMFLVHIAHPHGQSKHVTIGRQTDCFTGDGFYHQLYTAPTCPGCSGGPVWMIPASGDLSEVYGVPHSGCHGNKLNKGCSWTVYPTTKTLFDF